MKISAGRAESFLKSPDPSVRAVLIYGPDQGLVRERAGQLAGTVVDDPGDPFRLISLSASALSSDPQRLGDEAAALSLTGGRRVVRIHGAGNDLTRIFARFFEDPIGDALIIVEGGDLSPGGLRALFEKSDAAAALPCYRDDQAALASLVQNTMRDAGKSIDRSVVRELVELLGTDRLVTRAELEKLLLYVGARTQISDEDVAACVGDSAVIGLDELIMAAASGDHGRAGRAIHRLRLDGTSPVAMLRALLRHLQRLHRTVGAVEAGARPDQAIRQLRPPVHFKLFDRFRDQVQRWNRHDLATAMALVDQAEADAKTTGMPGNVIAGLAILRITAAARRQHAAARVSP